MTWGTTRHHCHAHDCDTPVPARMFVCFKHWHRLRLGLKRAIWREYTDGQEIRKNPSLRYLAVQQRAIAELAFRPNDEEAALVCARYMADSEEWRKKAIDAGFGDPLNPNAGFSD